MRQGVPAIINPFDLFSLEEALRLKDKFGGTVTVVCMQTLGSADVAAFFRQMAHFSRLHLAEATERGGFRHPPVLKPEEYQWPDGTSPETAAWAGVDGFMRCSGPSGALPRPSLG